MREASLTVEDMDGTCLNGRDGLEILGAALEGERRRETELETIKRYEGFAKVKRRRKERTARREWMLDMFCTALGVSVFLLFLLMMAFR